jgi:nucleoside-diphosphate-sugar epimerase
VPGSGMQITQLGHVKDLATAFVKILGNPKAAKQVYNIAGDKYATFDGIAKACAAAAGVASPELVHFNPKDFDFGKAKSFPMRDQHFFADVAKAKAELGWAPEFDMLSGLKDSYAKDFGCALRWRIDARFRALCSDSVCVCVCVSRRGTFREKADFTADDMILAKLKK